MAHNPAAATTANATRVTPTGLIDEVMGVLARGANALFADLAQAAWGPQATLAALTGSLAAPRGGSARRDAA